MTPKVITKIADALRRRELFSTTTSLVTELREMRDLQKRKPDVKRQLYIEQLENELKIRKSEAS